MSDRVRTERLLQQLFIHADEGRFSIDGIKRFFGFVADFKEKLAVISHITNGQPARGPELLSIRHRNTAAGGQRNVFIEDGLVALVTRYHKGFYASGDAKVIHRYIPREVGELIVCNAKPFPHNVREDGTEVITDNKENEDSMDDDRDDEYDRGVTTDDRTAPDAVPRGAGGRHPVDLSRPFPGSGSNAHGWWEKYIVYVARAAGILYMEWDSHRYPDYAAIVFVTPKSVFTDGFQSFLNRQRELMRLDRIVIDECYMMLNKSETFRPQLQQLGRLHQCGVPMVFLTATLPPYKEARLFERIQVAREDISMHRERTNRHNVAYRVYRPMITSRYRSQTQ
ncbi:uncharacterized protein N7498_006824 [Penicillium cinerascens]|uniref:Helicase ATP-binding domain-containing protein n=1 Tax=Penicillium cinerascens TaxID=70096 RepID=A0A9W9SY10_9EURO|nr:uncharacterized protein N7498_006824 [Penicillium cinerascens]KAJ5202161.1 hypothetical protein N7498_006824 [Penicillium cinerascens]